jgi:hypothetical protein
MNLNLLSGILLSGILLNVIRLSVILMDLILLSYSAGRYYAECHSTDSNCG